MASDPKQRAIDVSDLQYYFDAIERDSLDRMSHSRRSSQVLAIRDKLLTMPDSDFALALQTIKNILNPASPAPQKEDDQKAKRKEAIELYEQSRHEKNLNPLKVNPL
ncbi:MAG: hypothetical protein NTX25_11110 [Proteobacteria bacterium]|nr:hypothetical protein [Pseudomonadota bacterium]